MTPKQAKTAKTKFQILVEAILERSVAKEFAIARKEWKVSGVYFVDDTDSEDGRGKAEYETCTCTHYPIKEVITITNKLTRDKLIVGNCCILKITADEKEKKKHQALLNAIKKHSFSKLLIETAYFQDHFISSSEYLFLTRKGKPAWAKRKVAELKARILKLYNAKYHEKP